MVKQSTRRGGLARQKNTNRTILCRSGKTDSIALRTKEKVMQMVFELK